MIGPLKRKDTHASKDRFCTEGCCTPKMFHNVIGGLFMITFVFYLYRAVFAWPEVCVYEACTPLPGRLLAFILMAFYGITAAIIVMSFLKPEEVKYRSVLSYICDFTFCFWLV